ncbi:MAG TPA: GNAT family N-acetyltransferase [Methanocella sp.]|nr:GNAT family N-acetyltransferase [Methanocella sp.]
MPVTITRERPDTPDAMALISELDAYLNPLYPLESQFGFSPEKMIRENVSFFIMMVDGNAAGCGGIKLFEDFGEVKRMYVRPEFRGLGLGRLMLKHLEDYALQYGIGLLRLETGARQPEALRLYEQAGFHLIPAFPPYQDHLHHSLFYEKRIDRSTHIRP